MTHSVAVVGAGSFGTALAIHLARASHDVVLWARSSDLADEMARTRLNAKYFPSAQLPSAVTVTSRLGDLSGTDLVLVAVPSHGFRQVLRRLLEARGSGRRLTLISAAKGIETDTLARMSEVTSQEASSADHEVAFGVLSGPSFAVELVAGSPTASVIAAHSSELARELQERLSFGNFRLYTTTDVAGVEIAGTAKNVIAIAAGAVAGLELGHNTLAALMTRGLHEVTRLGMACGGRSATFSGLAGLGDLVLTCTGHLSRNRTTGVELARGRTLEEIQRSTAMVAEGVINSRSLQRLAGRVDVEMPITDQMVHVLYEGKEPRTALEELMSRGLKVESEL